MYPSSPLCHPLLHPFQQIRIDHNSSGPMHQSVCWSFTWTRSIWEPVTVSMFSTTTHAKKTEGSWVPRSVMSKPSFRKSRANEPWPPQVPCGSIDSTTSGRGMQTMIQIRCLLFAFKCSMYLYLISIGGNYGDIFKHHQLSILSKAKGEKDLLWLAQASSTTWQYHVINMVDMMNKYHSYDGSFWRQSRQVAGAFSASWSTSPSLKKSSLDLCVVQNIMRQLEIARHWRFTMSHDSILSNLTFFWSSWQGCSRMQYFLFLCFQGKQCRWISPASTFFRCRRAMSLRSPSSLWQVLILAMITSYEPDQ